MLMLRLYSEKQYNETAQNPIFNGGGGGGDGEKGTIWSDACETMFVCVYVCMSSDVVK